MKLMWLEAILNAPMEYYTKAKSRADKNELQLKKRNESLTYIFFQWRGHPWSMDNKTWNCSEKIHLAIFQMNQNKNVKIKLGKR